MFPIHNRRESCTSTSSLPSISNSCVSPSEPGWRPSTIPISRCFSSPWHPCWSCWKVSASSFPTFSSTQPAWHSRIPSSSSSPPLAFSPTRTIPPSAPTCCIASSIARPNSTTTRLLLPTPFFLFSSNCTHILIIHLIISYYRVFAVFYGLAGRCADLVLANGSWTYNHLVSLWRQPHSENCGIPSFRALRRLSALRHHRASNARIPKLVKHDAKRQ